MVRMTLVHINETAPVQVRLVSRLQLQTPNAILDCRRLGRNDWNVQLSNLFH